MTVFFLHVTLEDAYGRQSTKRYESEDISGVDLGAELLTFQGFVTTLLAALANLSEADVLAYNMGTRVTYTDTVDAGANLDEGITLSVRKLDNYKGILKVPAPVNSVVNADGTVDITDALVTAYYNHFLVTGGFTLSDGENAQALLSGRLDR